MEKKYNVKTVTNTYTIAAPHYQHTNYIELQTMVNITAVSYAPAAKKKKKTPEKLENAFVKD